MANNFDFEAALKQLQSGLKCQQTLICEERKCIKVRTMQQKTSETRQEVT